MAEEAKEAGLGPEAEPEARPFVNVESDAHAATVIRNLRAAASNKRWNPGLNLGPSEVSVQQFNTIVQQANSACLEKLAEEEAQKASTELGGPTVHTAEELDFYRNVMKKRRPKRPSGLTKMRLARTARRDEFGGESSSEDDADDIDDRDPEARMNSSTVLELS